MSSLDVTLSPFPSRAAFALAALFAVLTGCDQGQRIGPNRLDDFGRFGRSVDVSGLRAVVGAYQESNGTAEGAAYVFTRGGNTWSEQARLESPTPGDEQFGDDVAIFQNTIAVGAPLDNQPGALRSGSVYLYERTGNDWNHFQTLESPPLQQAWEAFGISVAVDDDVIVVGAVDRDQDRAIDAGAAFVYERGIGGTFFLVEELAAPIPLISDKFGSEVEVVGDTVVVAAVRKDLGATADAGVVYVFERDPAGWVLAQTLTASDASEDALFGTGLALDVDGSGSRRLVIGAEGDAGNQGAAYIFDAPAGGTFAETAKLVASDGSTGDIFGTSVALWNDVALVGASSDDDGGPNTGSVYAFRFDGSVWLEEAKLLAADPDANGNLGSSVAIDVGHALLGAPNSEIGTGTTDSGLVQAFRRQNNGTWIDSHTLNASGDDSATRYAYDLSIDGPWLAVPGPSAGEIYRLDADAYSLAQRVPAESGSRYESAAIDGTTVAFMGNRSGTAFPAYIEVWTESGGAWSQSQVLEPDLSGNAFELAQSAVVDLDGDTLVFGSQRHVGGDGRVIIYERNAGVFASSQIFTSPDAVGDFDRNYGSAVALDGDWLAVAETPSASVPGGTTDGSVYVYERVAGQFVQQQQLQAPVPANNDKYGRSIALSGDLLAVLDGAANLRVYRRTAGTYAEVWSVNDPAFGIRRNLAFSGDNLAVGASGTGYDGFTAAGEIRIYERQPDDSFVQAPGMYRASDAEDDLYLGGAVALDGTHVFGATDWGTSTRRRVYIFDL